MKTMIVDLEFEWTFGIALHVDKVERIASIFLPFIVVTIVWDGK